MRVFLAGGSGVLGTRLIPLLVQAGHDVVATTRSAPKAPLIEGLGARPVVCDILDRTALGEIVSSFSPAVLLHQVTDLPDDVSLIPEHAETHARVREQGTDSLIAAATLVSARVVAQSVAWELPGRAGEAVRYLERAVTRANGIVARYGQWYGPGTYHPVEPPAGPCIHVDLAARRTLELLDAPPGTYTLVE